MTDLSDTSVFRLHIRPEGADPQVSFAYCLREQVLGMGWAVHLRDQRPLTWEAYEALATDVYGSGALSRVRFLHGNVRKDDLVWTRDTRGTYFLGRVTSPWEYFETQGSLDADIVNVVRCRILEVADDAIPGKVVACFRPRRTIQRIADSAALTYTRFLWNKLSEQDDYPLPLLAGPSLFSLLDAETVEDVIFIYLQLQGWLVVPNSRKADTMSFEFVLINRETKERATVQVKTGDTPLDRSDWKDRGVAFLFQANGIYYGEEIPKVVCLSPEIILRFIMDNLPLMPAVVGIWSAFVCEHRSQL